MQGRQADCVHSNGAMGGVRGALAQRACQRVCGAGPCASFGAAAAAGGVRYTLNPARSSSANLSSHFTLDHDFFPLHPSIASVSFAIIAVHLPFHPAFHYTQCKLLHVSCSHLYCALPVDIVLFPRGDKIGQILSHHIPTLKLCLPPLYDFTPDCSRNRDGELVRVVS